MKPLLKLDELVVVYASMCYSMILTCSWCDMVFYDVVGAFFPSLLHFLTAKILPSSLREGQLAKRVHQ